MSLDSQPGGEEEEEAQELGGSEEEAAVHELLHPEDPIDPTKFNLFESPTKSVQSPGKRGPGILRAFPTKSKSTRERAAKRRRKEKEAESSIEESSSASD